MSPEACILTTKDLTILEIMLERCLGRDDPLAPVLRRKMASATIVFRDDVPADVVTLNSRAMFSVDGLDSDTRVISHESSGSAVGLFLPVTSARGLTLIGMSEGQEARLCRHDGTEETILLEKVLYQPEAARREKAKNASEPSPVERRPALRLIRGAYYGEPRPIAGGGANKGVTGGTGGGFDDPGPSAA
jgi:regulator of nucleoside diphosphate kinase